MESICIVIGKDVYMDGNKIKELYDVFPKISEKIPMITLSFPELKKENLLMIKKSIEEKDIKVNFLINPNKDEKELEVIREIISSLEIGDIFPLGLPRKKIEGNIPKNYLFVTDNYTPLIDALVALKTLIAKGIIKDWKEYDEKRIIEELPTKQILPFEKIFFFGESFNGFPATMKNTKIFIIKDPREILRQL